MAKCLAGQTAVLTTRVRGPHAAARFSVKCKVTTAFYDDISGPTEFIFPIVVNNGRLVSTCARVPTYIADFY